MKQVTPEIISLDLFSTLVFVDRNNFDSRKAFYKALMESSKFREKFPDETSLTKIVDHYHNLLREEMYDYEKEEEFDNEELLQRTLITLFEGKYPDLASIVKEPIKIYFENLNSHLHIFEGLHKTLDYLKSKEYRLIMVSNHSYPSHGEEVLRRFRLRQYFDRVVFSGNIGYRKPSKKIFSYALDGLSFKSRKNVIHVGDDFIADIEGAIDFGLRAIWIKNNHFTKRVAESSLEFQAISEIKDLMGLF
ncbi:MAG: HAD family hydrolase [Candidatus Hodarchaeales archaeon]